MERDIMRSSAAEWVE